MTFSLVLATIDRTQELARFLSALALQSYPECELIVVDQNLDGRLMPILDSYRHRLRIIHTQSGQGLSRGRNVGLPHATGEIIGFPDDDCWYPGGLLQRLATGFKENPTWDGITGLPIDESGSVYPGKWDPDPGFSTRANIWRRGISFTVFLRRRVTSEVGLFDETLGLGAGTPWGSGEETDYLLSAIAKGFRIFYDPSIVVHHPRHASLYDADARRKTYRYAMGMGRVLKKHRYPHAHVFYRYVFRPLAGLGRAVLLGQIDRAKNYWAIASGRLKGYLTPRQEK